MSSSNFEVVTASQSIVAEVTTWPGVTAGRGGGPSESLVHPVVGHYSPLFGGSYAEAFAFPGPHCCSARDFPGGIACAEPQPTGGSIHGVRRLRRSFWRREPEPGRHRGLATRLGRLARCELLGPAPSRAAGGW